MAQNHKVILTPPKTSFCLGRNDCRNVRLYLLTCKVIDELDLRKMFSRNCYDKLLYFKQEDVFYSSDILQMFEFGIESNYRSVAMYHRLRHLQNFIICFFYKVQTILIFQKSFPEK